MKSLLDKDLINGSYETHIALRPEVFARVVRDRDDAVEAITRLCQIWGGASNPLLPLAEERAPEYLVEQLIASECDGFTGEEDQDISISGLERGFPSDYPVAVIVAREKRENLRPIVVTELDPSDPWMLPYLGMFGWLPDAVDREILDHANIANMEYAQVIPFRREKVKGGFDHLLSKISRRGEASPKVFSVFELATGAGPNTGFMGIRPVFPDRWRAHTAAGPNIVVAMSPGSFEDLALLWNLRAYWGDERAMPIGLPVNEITRDRLLTLARPGVAQAFGLAPISLHLVSATVSPERLQKMATMIPNAVATEPASLVRLTTAPHRAATSVTQWTDGAGRVPALGEEDRQLFRIGFRGPRLKVSVNVPDEPVPSIQSLRSTFGYDFQAGAAQVDLGDINRLKVHGVAWPSKWTCLEAAALDKGLEVRPSSAGQDAHNLIRTIGSAQDLLYLADPDLLALLYNMAEQSGMSWFKQRSRRLAQTLTASASDSERLIVTEALDRIAKSVAPTGEGRRLPYSRFKEAIGSSRGADKWIPWATQARLIVKGFDFLCKECGVENWVAQADLRPPFTCQACGALVLDPFGPTNLSFKYSIGEVLRRCLESDSLGHALALRWLTELFGGRGFVGAFPGVEFVRAGQAIAEVDVVLLFSDGRIVPVEVKRRAAGFGNDEVRRMDRVADLLEADFDVMCVLEDDLECESVRGYCKELPGRPRFLLTMTNLSQVGIFWPAGAHPFAPIDRGESQGRKSGWQSAVERIGEYPSDWVGMEVSTKIDNARASREVK